MSGGDRTPQQLLDELGAQLDAARRVPGRRLKRRRAGRLAALIIVAAGAGTSVAAATTWIFASSPPLPRLDPRAVILASGSTAGEPWQLLVSRCDRRDGAVSLLLASATGGAGTACGRLVQPAATVYDPRASRALVFGAVPAGTAEVELALGAQRQRVAPTRAGPRALASAMLPDGSAFYVTTIPRDQVVTAMAGFDASGQLVVACRVERCATP